MNQREFYFGQERRDVAALVPADAQRVLDVGCGFGALGRLLARERGCRMHGIERNPEAAEHLRGRYDRHIIGDVETAADAFAGDRFDCIVFADVLEHLVDPWAVLARYRNLLAPGGSVVASIPNTRNFALLYNLLVGGRWTYTESGLLDRTHLRFFTRAEIHPLFAGAGLSIERIEEIRERYHPWMRALAALPVFLVPDLLVFQFLVLARPAADAP